MRRKRQPPTAHEAEAILQLTKHLLNLAPTTEAAQGVVLTVVNVIGNIWDMHEAMGFWAVFESDWEKYVGHDKNRIGSAGLTLNDAMPEDAIKILALDGMMKASKN